MRMWRIYLDCVEHHGESERQELGPDQQALHSIQTRRHNDVQAVESHKDRHDSDSGQVRVRIVVLPLENREHTHIVQLYRACLWLPRLLIHLLHREKRQNKQTE